MQVFQYFRLISLCTSARFFRPPWRPAAVLVTSNTLSHPGCGRVPLYYYRRASGSRGFPGADIRFRTGAARTTHLNGNERITGQAAVLAGGDDGGRARRQAPVSGAGEASPDVADLEWTDSFELGPEVLDGADDDDRGAFAGE